MNHFTRHARSLTAIAGSAVVVLAIAAGARADGPAVIVYQCPDGQQICGVSPSDGSPTVLAQAGTLAGVTRDGATYGYAADSTVPGQEGLWEAPVAGGTPTEINSGAVAGGAGSPDPVMSADGSAVLERQEQFGTGFASDSDDIYAFSTAPGPSSQPTVIDSSTLFGMTYGWLGDTAVTTHASDAGLQPPTWACLGYQTDPDDTFCADTDPSARLQSASQTINAPDGSPDGTEIVAAVGSPGQSGGAIELFSASTGASIGTVLSPPAGSEYTSPRFSPDGTQIVFESDPASGSGSIQTVSVNGGTPTTIAQGTNPFWGGTTAPSPTPGPAPGPGPTPTPMPAPGPTKRPPAPKITLTVPHQTLTTDLRARHILVSCKLAAASTCKVTATIPAKTAKKLKLKVARKTKTYTLASASKTLRHKGTARIALKLSAKTAKALTHARSVKLTLAATSTQSKHTTRTTSRTVTLR